MIGGSPSGDGALAQAIWYLDALYGDLTGGYICYVVQEGGKFVDGTYTFPRGWKNRYLPLRVSTAAEN